ncbi:hypothetical protein [Desulfonatronovibrio magnus]|uniref:hypothetical protein n=1 Tax=Desulfonatronovibrio magnus TaxID=698827 RepID=UPI0005EB525E|nr:hypothetical protein [Desulfonatronovibrio magnus]
MKMKEIRAIAREIDIKIPVTLSKIEAVRLIQRTEGNFDCFARAADGFCDQDGCIFLEDCLILSPKQNKAK